MLRLQLLGAKRLPVQVIYQATGVFPLAVRAGGLVVDWGKVDSQDPAVIREVRRRFDAKRAGVAAAAKVGADEVIWPDAIRAEMDLLNKDIGRLLTDLDADKKPELATIKNSYKEWVVAWRAWEKENRDSWTMFFFPTKVRTETRQWQANQNVWRAEFARRGVTQSAPPIPPPPSPVPGGGSPVLSTLDNISYALIVAALVGGGIYIAKTVKG